MHRETEIEKLIYDLIYHRYMMNKDKDKTVFSKLSLREYIVLHHFVKTSNGNKEKLYLSDLSEELNLSIHQISKLATQLRDRGVVTWSHDGNGADGSYLTVTDVGMKLLDEQERKLFEHYEKIINSFGKQEMLSMISELRRFEDIVERERANEGGMLADGMDEAE